jgi:phosphate transport system permease protein
MVLAILPLVVVLGYTIAKGLARFDKVFLTHSMRNVAESDPGGGAYHAIIGTIEQVGIATIIAVPIGLLVSIYLVEYAQGKRYGRLVSTFVDVMTGLPSIVAGLFILSFWIIILGHDFSGFAGSLALIIIMLPVVVRTTEEMLRLVPDPLREASAALGVPRWRTTVSVVLPTALPGITTGVMLAIARVMGETAPVLLTVFGTQSINNNPFNGPQESLPLFVFSEAGQPNQTAIDRAWAGALTLILIVVILNVVARLIVSRRALR